MNTWTSQALRGYHDLTGLMSGDQDVDRWLRQAALRAHEAGTAHTTVWTAPDDVVVRAFHSTAPTQFARIDLPSRSLSAGYTHVPGYLIARLALDESLRGQGLGTELLLDALEQIVAAASSAGGRLIAVDAIDANANGFYRHHGFQPIEHSNRLVMKVATAKAALDR